MPRHFDDRMIEDAVHCIRTSDVISEESKARLVRQVLALRQPQCRTVPSCQDCRLADGCESRIGAILNGENDTKSDDPPFLRLVVSNVA